MIPVSGQSVPDRHLGVLHVVGEMTCHISEPK